MKNAFIFALLAGLSAAAFLPTTGCTQTKVVEVVDPSLAGDSELADACCPLAGAFELAAGALCAALVAGCGAAGVCACEPGAAPGDGVLPECSAVGGAALGFAAVGGAFGTSGAFTVAAGDTAGAAGPGGAGSLGSSPPSKPGCAHALPLTSTTLHANSPASSRGALRPTQRLTGCPPSSADRASRPRLDRSSKRIAGASGP